ncbi:MAG: hypothetical protein CMM77_07005 [Rhodospirillaceae bacterium]|nr:hypothetical protein [Magnetovibrio sp.]MAY66859.1 hypothetical protein [Rhodospirillaceae bacterium]
MKAYHFRARTRAKDGTTEPFKLDVAAPEKHGDGGYGCVIHCPIMPFHGNPIFGVDGRQAMALALWITEQLLAFQELELIDDDGDVITLPIDQEAGIPGGPDRDDL